MAGVCNHSRESTHSTVETGVSPCNASMLSPQSTRAGCDRGSVWRRTHARDVAAQPTASDH
eukprot:scaffold119087_cov60-Phaeocystis_antarctica.AAC.2